MFGNIPVLRRKGTPEGDLTTRRPPERGLFDLFEEFVNDTWPSRFGPKDLAEWRGFGGMALDMDELDDEFVVRAELPGIDPKEVDVTVERGVLTIRGERKSEHEDKKHNLLHQERVFGSFSRSVSLPGAIDETRVSAKYEKGVLIVHLPKSEESKAKRIEIE